MNYLIDTCVVSDFFKKIPSVIQHFQQLSPTQIYVSTITAMEIEFGLILNKEQEKKIRPQWEQLIKNIVLVPFSNACALSAASIRSQLKKAGLPIGPFDILIAGTAMANDLIMVTSNFKEFNRVRGLIIEDWRRK